MRVGEERAEGVVLTPRIEYSRRMFEPTEPEKTMPVVTPTDACRSRSASALRMKSAQYTARCASSSWYSGGRPKTPVRSMRMGKRYEHIDAVQEMAARVYR